MKDYRKCKLEDAKIMILDDNQANLKLLERILQLNGFKNTLTLEDSRKALDTYMSFQPDLLLLDLKMPYMDGFDVLKELKQFVNDYLPIMMITAQTEHENRLEALGIGALDFISKPFDSTELLSRIRNFLRIRLLNKKLYENNGKLEQTIQDQSEEISNMQIELIERLLKAAEFRNHETGEHIKRIGNYAYMLAKETGQPEDFARTLFQASKMHDIGKIGISDEILLKPGQLNDNEWESMKKHTVKGAQILAGSTSFVIKMAENVALTHHEKWDGTGYPHGLKGEEIPIEGRITAICDVFDALISKRSYKPAWSVDEALSDIKQESGKHFDPALADCFVNNIEKILSIELN